jgi:DNA-binding response OmpR family regulator
VSPLILIVEDEIDLAMTLQYRLRKEGYRTSVAHAGEDALEQAKDGEQPELVILDLNLPDMSGFKVCRRLRRDPRFAETPILMVTARAAEKDRKKGMKAGATDYLLKPFSPRDLLQRVSTLLAREHERDAV